MARTPSEAHTSGRNTVPNARLTIQKQSTATPPTTATPMTATNAYQTNIAMRQVSRAPFHP